MSWCSRKARAGKPLRSSATWAVRRFASSTWEAVSGAISPAAPGAQSSRKVLAEPLSGRIFLAGEATHETLWGSVNGAWESGERAADAVVKLLGGPSKRG